ncbi:methyltransferase domain-containing protein, partial [Myxococcota bacterium]|nr:methyltransferase domain-containing protein [Myxococcota bacterium]
SLRLAEHRRLPQVATDLHAFWHDYLVGRDGSIGIELLTASSAYRKMMEEQIVCLDGEPGLQIADLGAGTGALAIALATSPSWFGPTTVYAMDYVRPALRRASERLGQRDPKSHAIALRPVETNLDLSPGGPGIPAADKTFDRVMASLLIGYLAHPERLLAEMFRILRPGGRMVLSSLARDADISRLYVEAFEELKAGEMQHALPELQLADGANLARNFLNDAARILELEDVGAFRFMDAEDLSRLAAGAGFVDIETRPGLGVPPQAVVLSAARPAI